MAMADPFDGPPPPLQPVVRRAEAFLRANLGERFTIRDLSREIGISSRALHMAFIKHVGAPPMRYLKMLRLSGAREDLCRAPPGTLVTDVAVRWGFCHFGRFASDYLRCFGERPSATLDGRRLGAARLLLR